MKIECVCGREFDRAGGTEFQEHLLFYHRPSDFGLSPLGDRGNASV